VAPVFQPLWAQADAYVRDLTWPGLGAERSAALYPIGAVAAAAAELAFGSDWSVSSVDPLQGIEVAVTRRDADADGGEPLCPDQAIGVDEAVAAYTRGAGRAVPLDGVGVLRVGARGDLVVLDADPRAVAPSSLGDIRVALTVVGGRIVDDRR
jgi:predicted amidohydrolase YtcJ